MLYPVELPLLFGQAVLPHGPDSAQSNRCALPLSYGVMCFWGPREDLNLGTSFACLACHFGLLPYRQISRVKILFRNLNQESASESGMGFRPPRAC